MGLDSPCRRQRSLIRRCRTGARRRPRLAARPAADPDAHRDDDVESYDFTADQRRPHGGGELTSLPAGGGGPEEQAARGAQRRQVGRRLRSVPRQYRGADQDTAVADADQCGDKYGGQYGRCPGVLTCPPRRSRQLHRR